MVKKKSAMNNNLTQTRGVISKEGQKKNSGVHKKQNLGSCWAHTDRLSGRGDKGAQTKQKTEEEKKKKSGVFQKKKKSEIRRHSKM